MNIDHFWWSGGNRERDRREAANRLLQVLHKLQTENIGVHLIGHSHGGSIIQYAVIQAESKSFGKRLENIRSISSVGTPYIDFRPHPWGWMWLLVALVLVILIRIPFADVATSMWEFTRQPDRSYDGTQIIDLEWLFAVTARWPEAIAQEHNPLTYVPLPICLIFTAFSTLYFLRWAVRWLRIAARYPWVKTAEKRYEGIWNPIFSRHDEAINGLILMDRLQLEQITPRFSGWFWLYDQLIAPLVDQFFTEIARDSAMGADCVGEFASGVTNHPFGLKRDSVEPLQSDIDASLVHMADATAKDTVVRLRTSLTARASNIGRTFSEKALAGMVIDHVLSSTNGELVHNQYFDSREVQGMLANHILQPTIPTAFAPVKAFVHADRRRYRRARSMIAAIAIMLALCSLFSNIWLDGRVNYERAIIVASKDFDESEIMGEILAQKLRLDGRFPNAEFRNTDYTSREILQQAAMQDIQVYMEYTGSLFRWLDSPKKELYASSGNVREVDPKEAPRFDESDATRDFKRWLARRRSTNRQLASFAAGNSLGVSSPYVLTMIRSRPAGLSLFKILMQAEVIVSIDEERRKAWESDCPGIRIDYQLDFPKFQQWLRTSNLPKPVRFGLTQTLLTNDSGIRSMLLSLNNDVRKQIDLTPLPHPDKFAALRSGTADFVDGYGTDPELFVSQSESEFCGLAISGLTDPQQRFMGEVLIPYAGFPLVSLPRRAQRNAVLKAIERPSSVENPTGKINQLAFANLLKVFREEVTANKAVRENADGARDKFRRELVSKHWDGLFVVNVPKPQS